MAVKFWNNLKICGAYFVYLFIFLWMFTKEFLGYQVDWSWRPHFAPDRPNQEKQETNSHKVKDLEANLNPDQSASTGLLDDSENEEKSNDGCDTGHLIIYEAHPVQIKKATSVVVTDREPASQTLLPPPVISEPQSQQQTRDRAKDSPGVHFSISTVTQSDGKDVSHVNPELGGFAAKAFKDALHEHQQLEDATTSRLNFVKGLKYKENNNFRFPAILSALRAKSIKPRHAPKRDMFINLPPSAIITPALTTRPPTKLEASSMFTATSTIPEPKQTILASDEPPSPYLLSLSLTPVQTSTSSVSSYSSTYTIVESSHTDLTTPADEDIPINFTRSLPSWRRDPDRAKFVFGSLARSIVSLNDDGKSGDDEGHFTPTENSKAEGERISPTNDMITSPHPAIIAKECSALKNPRLESMILAMGLSPLPTASTLRSDSGAIEDKDKGQEEMQPNNEQCDDGTNSGLAASLVNTMKSREPVMSDLLSWVESSSSICCQ